MDGGLDGQRVSVLDWFGGKFSNSWGNVLGWFFTHSKQERLLNLQLSADRSKAKYDLSAPRRIREVMELLDWLKSTAQNIMSIVIKIQGRANSDQLTDDLEYTKLLENYRGWSLQETQFHSMALINWDKYSYAVNNIKISALINDLISPYGDLVNFASDHFGKENTQARMKKMSGDDLYLSLVEKITYAQIYAWRIVEEIEAGK
jgi:hypothetical protein